LLLPRTVFECLHSTPYSIKMSRIAVRLIPLDKFVDVITTRYQKKFDPRFEFRRMKLMPYLFKIYSYPCLTTILHGLDITRADTYILHNTDVDTYSSNGNHI
jgi:hypothetical protein